MWQLTMAGHSKDQRCRRFGGQRRLVLVPQSVAQAFLLYDSIKNWHVMVMNYCSCFRIKNFETLKAMLHAVKNEKELERLVMRLMLLQLPKVLFSRQNQPT